MNGVGLYANRNSRGDFVQTAFEGLSDPPGNVYVAVAFFTDPVPIERLVTTGSLVRIVVRLGFPTSAQALQQIMRLTPNVEIRYFTDRSFHPKLFLFGTRAALVGSANLTHSALLTNQEVMLHLGEEDVRLPELATLFNEYWNDAKVLTQPVLETYRELCVKYGQMWKDESRIESELNEKVGKVAGRNITREHAKQTQENLFLEDYRKTYQEGVAAFKVIQRVYESVGKRKVPETKIPLRLEIDSFISFIREKIATGDTWMSAPISSGAEQQSNIRDLIEKWHSTYWEYFEEDIVNEKYPRLIRVFRSAEAIAAASDDDLFDALSTVHSFYERLRFFPGGLVTWKKTFLAANDPARTRDNLKYLIYGPGELEDRMGNLIYSPTYKLNEFGQSNVQELVGWINNKELPVINGRTTKVLRFLGFDVKQLS